MSQTTMPAWECDKCLHLWPVTKDDAGKIIVPQQCRKCRSRLWNSGKEVAPVSGVYGGKEIDYSKQFRRLRKKMNIPQVKLAALIGISLRQVANIEGGVSQPSMKTTTMFNALYARHMENQNV